MLAQRSFEDLGTPLSEITFCVVDLETTGASPKESNITEIGALKVRRGEVQGSFRTLVDPGEPVPSFIRLLTGISDEMLIEAPRIAEVLPSFLEFVGGAVLVAHNARFDVSFLNEALTRNDYPRLRNRVLDTAALARKILSGEVRNNKLETLARHLRCAHRPCHRAFEDVLATTDVLHHLIERVAGFGVTTLEDLVSVSGTKIDQTFSKITLTDALPPTTGVYRFLDAGGRTLYVGKATDLRARTRSYFYGDPRRRIRNLLRETQAISFEEHDSLIEAEVAEARAIAAERPPYNRAGKNRPGSPWYLRFELRRKVPRMAAARTPKDDGSVYVGPFTSMRAVRELIDALKDALDIHRCNDPVRCRGCAFSELQRCTGPDGQTDEVKTAALAAVCAPRSVLIPLRERMGTAASRDLFERAGEIRAAGELLERTLTRHIALNALVDAGDLILADDARAHLIRRGRLIASADRNADDRDTVDALHRIATKIHSPVQQRWMEPALAREARVLDRWIRRTGDLTILHAGRTWAWPAAAGPTGWFEVKRYAT